MNPDVHLHVLVLAAGKASRFGSPKQLARVDGQPLLQRAVSQACEITGATVSVVLGAHAAQLTPMLKNTTASVLINRQWEEGIASSLRLGVAQLTGGCDAVLITLADQAAITGFDLKRLVNAWRQQPEWLVAASYAGHTGVPAIFPAHTFGGFAGLRGDAGARSIIQRHVDRCLRIAMPSAAIDIDTPEDLLKLQSRGQASVTSP